MLGRVSQSSSPKSSEISCKHKVANNSTEERERENIAPLTSFSPHRTNLEREEAVVAYGKKNSNPDIKANEEVRSRANLFYLAKLNRNNPIRDSVFGGSTTTDSVTSRSSEVDKDKDKEGLEELYSSVCGRPDIPDFQSELEEMRRSRRIAGVGVQKSPTKKSGSSRKALGSINRSRKGVKRPQSPIQDDSIMIISSMDEGEADLTPTGLPQSEIVQLEGWEQKLKRIRLFQSPPPQTENIASRVGVNETIDLVDDDDDFESISSDEEVVLLDDETAEDSGNDDIEIIGVRIVPKQSRSRSNSRCLTSPWVKSGTRNSTKNNISFHNVQQSVKRAKKRMSNMHISRTATNRTVSKNQKKKKKSMPKISSGGAVAFQQQARQVYQNRYKRPRSRRTTVPIFMLDEELGPQNPAWNKNKAGPSARVHSRLARPHSRPARPPQRAAEFIPISSINTANSGPGPVTYPPASSTATSQCLATEPDENSAQTNTTAAPVHLEAFNLMCVPGSTRNCVPGTPRPIIIDASNIAMAHGMNNQFSCRGIQICVEYFRSRGHSEIIAFVPRFRCKSSESVDGYILNQLEEQGVLKFTPSREVGGQRIASYDDRYIVQYAAQVHGIIISNDNYRDIYDQQEDWRDQIQLRVLGFTWVREDCIMFPWDPLGRYGPSLEKFLRF